MPRARGALEAQQAEVAFLGGRIVTMADDRPEAEAVLCRGGRILCVGSDAEVRSRASAGAAVVDLAGRRVIPGLIDAHCHLEMTVTSLKYWLQLHSTIYHSIREMCAALAERAKETPAGEWIVGRADFSLALFVEEKRPILRSDLDKTVPDHPCVVFAGFHVATLNTAALKATGLLDGTATLPMGSSVDVEAGRAMDVWDWLPLPNPGRKKIAVAIRDLGRSLWTARGVTSVGELPFRKDGIRALQDLRRSGELPLRLGLWMHVPLLGTIDELLAAGLETGFGDEWLRLGGIKLFVDGAGFGLDGAPLFDVKRTQDELDEIVFKAHTAGLQLWLHTAPTLEGADMALTAYERALEREPRADHRHRIEHVGDLEPRLELLQRIARSAVTPVTTPQFTWSYGDENPDFGATPLVTLKGMGFRPPGNSDSTGTQPEAVNPWHGIRCAVTHATRAGNVLLPEERVDLETALRMYTRDAAWACHFDDRGVLAPGYLADLVVLGVDPFELPPDELTDVPVDMTVIGGEVAWSQ